MSRAAKLFKAGRELAIPGLDHCMRCDYFDNIQWPYEVIMYKFRYISNNVDKHDNNNYAIVQGWATQSYYRSNY
jgi:hypothetical protein